MTQEEILDYIVSVKFMFRPTELRSVTAVIHWEVGLPTHMESTSIARIWNMIESEIKELRQLEEEYNA